MALDLSNQTPPTPRGEPTRKNPSKTSARAQAAKTQEREDGLNGLFQLGAFAALTFGQHADAGACATHGPNISREVATLAENNDSIGKTVDYLTGVGPYAALIAALMPFTLQILVNHNRIPNSPALAQFGVYPPEMLAQQATLQAQQQQAALAEQLRAQQEELQRQQNAA